MLIDKFFETGRRFLGCKYPIMCGAMTWVSDPKLVSTIGNAGGFGLLAGGNTPVDKIQPLNEIISEVVNDAESEFQRLKGIFNRQD
jgi:NAD(P)H-dependent flavin oxidoreductase YrpB (nitropropane dioxygenase family)